MTTHFIKNVDLFSTPFSFLVGDKKNKKTILGGILSLLVLSASISYLYYLMKMYFNNQLEPRITSRSYIDDVLTEISIEKNQFVFEFLIDGEPLKQYEKRTGKTYLTYILSYDFYYLNGTWDSIEVPMKECSLENFQGLLTFDESALIDKKLMINPLLLTNSEFGIQIYPCDPSIESNCANEQEILDVIFTPVNYLQTFTKIQQFNPTSRKYEDQYRSEYQYLDPILSIFTRINLMKATTNVIEGILIQSESEKQTVYDYKKIDVFFSQKNQYKRKGEIEYALIVFDLNQQQTAIVVQFPMITEVFAQFTSIFNSLLLIGFIARALAQKNIVEELNEVLLKQYYKKTAAKLISNNQAKIKESKNFEKNIDQILDLQTKINEEHFCTKNRKLFKLGISDRFRIFFSHLFKIGANSKVKSSNRDENYEKQIYLKLRNVSLNKINIFEMLKDLYQLKMAIKLIFTKEQYAAIQFCGSELFLEDTSNQKIKIDKDNNIHKEEKQNNEDTSNKIINGSPFSMKAIHHIQSFPALNLTSMEQFNQNQTKDSLFIDKMKFIHSSYSIPINKNDEIIDKSDEIIEITEQKQSQQLEKSLGDVPLDMTESNKNNLTQIKHQVSKKFKEKLFEIQTEDNSSQQQNNFPLDTNSISQQKQEQHPSQKSIFFANQSRSHLEEMDLIEENQDVSEQYLQKFLNLVKQEEQEQSSSFINRQIFQSLLINDEKIIFPQDEVSIMLNKSPFDNEQKYFSSDSKINSKIQNSSKFSNKKIPLKKGKLDLNCL